METRSVTVGGTAQTDLPGRRIERSMNGTHIQAVAPTGNE
jgi:hypothetical protein